MKEEKENGRADLEEYQTKITNLRNEIKKVKDDFVKSRTILKVGDYIKFIEKGDSYNFEPDIKHIGIICGFEVYYDGSIYVKCQGLHFEPKLENVDKCRKPRNLSK